MATILLRDASCLLIDLITINAAPSTFGIVSILAPVLYLTQRRVCHPNTTHRRSHRPKPPDPRPTTAPVPIMLRSSCVSVLAATYIPCLVTALACRRAPACAPGLTAWSDANFAGASHQYNVSWDTCGMSILGAHPPAKFDQVSNIFLNSIDRSTIPFYPTRWS